MVDAGLVSWYVGEIDLQRLKLRLYAKTVKRFNLRLTRLFFIRRCNRLSSL
jgi:hypothetical protein